MSYGNENTLIPGLLIRNFPLFLKLKKWWIGLIGNLDNADCLHNVYSHETHYFINPDLNVDLLNTRRPRGVR